MAGASVTTYIGFSISLEALQDGQADSEGEGEGAGRVYLGRAWI